MKKRFLGLIFLIIFLIMPGLSLADGMVIKRDPYSDRWDYLNEDEQQAYINYEDNLEKMIIGINTEDTNENALWLFPVPADPSKVVIDVVTNFPQLSGEEINKRAKSNLVDAQEYLHDTQIYPAIFYSFLTLSLDGGGPRSVGTMGLSPGGSVGYESDISVYEHLEKEGLTTEIITAKKAESLYKYLENKKLKIEQGSIPILDHYIGKDYTFIATWIVPKNYSYSDIEAKITDILEKYNYYLYSGKYSSDNIKIGTNFKSIIDPELPEVSEMLSASSRGEDQVLDYFEQNPDKKTKFISLLMKNNNLVSAASTSNERGKSQKGVFVTFPSEKIYYPLLPTSVYESKIIPVTIRIIGYRNPEVFDDIKNYTKTEYYYDQYYKFNEEIKNFYHGEDQNIGYTKIKIDAPSKMFTDDLWINAKVPFWQSLNINYGLFISQNLTFVTIALLIICSIITGILIGLVFFRQLRNKKGILKLLLLGLSNCLSIIGLIITTLFISTKKRDENIDPLIKEIRQKKYIWKRRLALILLITVLPLVIIFSTLLILLTSWFYLIILTAVILVPLMIKKIKPEDKPLFAQLKSAGYSTWTFIPKDRMKWAFVPVFSISFLIISYLIILIMKTIL